MITPTITGPAGPGFTMTTLGGQGLAAWRSWGLAGDSSNENMVIEARKNSDLTS